MYNLYYISLSGESLERSYFGNLSAIQLNGYYAAALFDGKVQLHLVCAFNVTIGCRQCNSSLPQIETQGPPKLYCLYPNHIVTIVSYAFPYTFEH